MSSPASPLPPEPRANPDLFGHADAARTLEEAARSGRLHHAWLIAGPPGLGKATLAYRFARWLLAGQPSAGQPSAARPPAGQPAAPEPPPPLALDPRHPVFRRVAAGAHADLLTIEPGTLQGDRKRTDVINVDAARLIPGFMALTAAEGGWRVVVLDGAELMNPAAANALLKALDAAHGEVQQFERAGGALGAALDPVERALAGLADLAQPGLDPGGVVQREPDGDAARGVGHAAPSG